MSTMLVDGNGFWFEFDTNGGSWSAMEKKACDDWSRKHRRVAAPSWRLLHAGQSHCHCCKMPWAVVSVHNTSYKNGSGMFPLCERCWMERTPEERLPYYRELWEEWQVDSPGHADWDDIEKAVLSEDRVCRVFGFDPGVSAVSEVALPWGDHHGDVLRATTRR